jgi:hypothetical protein
LPQLASLLLLRLAHALALRAPVALLDPFGLGARPSLRPKTEEAEAVLAIDGDSDQFTQIVARTDEVGGENEKLEGAGV